MNPAVVLDFLGALGVLVVQGLFLNP